MKNNKKIFSIIITICFCLIFFTYFLNNNKSISYYTNSDDYVFISEKQYREMSDDDPLKTTYTLKKDKREMYEYIIDINGPYHFYSTEPKLYILGTETSIWTAKNCELQIVNKNICDWKIGDIYWFQRNGEKLEEVILFADWIYGKKLNN